MVHPILYIMLQVWAGVFYLLNKICFSRKERNRGKQKLEWQIAAWVVYIIGLPAWVIFFGLHNNWIAAAVEAGGAPSMILGLSRAIQAWRDWDSKQPEEFRYQEPPSLVWVARLAVLGGLLVSIWQFGGITTSSQICELGVSVGFLMGTYLLAKDSPKGYFWFMLMNGSNAVLMLIQGSPWLMIQQLISLLFVIDACVYENRHRTRV